MSNDKKHYLINTITILIGLVISYAVLYKGGNNMFGLDSGTVAIVVALISVAGSLIAHWFLFKKNSNTMITIKSDTSEIKPSVIDTNDIVKALRDTTYKELLPMVRMVEESGKGVSQLIDDLKFQERIRKENSSSITDRDFIMNGIAEIYQKNFMLETTNKELMKTVRILEMKNNALKNEVEQISEQIHNAHSNSKEPYDFGM